MQLMITCKLHTSSATCQQSRVQEAYLTRSSAARVMMLRGLASLQASPNGKQGMLGAGSTGEKKRKKKKKDREPAG